MDGKNFKDWQIEISAAKRLRNKMKVQRLGKVFLTY